MTENSTALLFDILDTATQGDPDSAANNIALLNQLLSATGNDPSDISANEIALLTEILSIITDQPPDVAANEIAVLTEILSAIQTQNPQVRENKIALLNEIAANSQSLVDALGPLPVAASDLIAWYPFREGTGVDATAGDSNFGDTTDYSATVNGATYKPNGGVTDIQTGANSGAFEFDGTDDELDAGASQGLSPQSLTLIAVTKADVTKVNMRVVHNRDKGKGGYILTNDGDKVSFSTHANGDFFTTEITANVQGDFVTLAGSYDNGTARLNLNGGQQIATNAQPYDNSFFTPFEIAPAGEFGSPRFDGVIDEVRLYSPALSQSEISEIHNNINP